MIVGALGAMHAVLYMARYLELVDVILLACCTVNAVVTLKFCALIVTFITHNSI
jgi:hypothetical protein